MTPLPDAPVSVEFLSAIIDAVAHPIFVKDREFRFVLLNRVFCEMVGYAREELLGKTDYDFFPAAEADFFRAKDVEMFASGSEVAIAEEPITDATGVRHVLATTKVPLVGPDGTVTHLVGIIHDITRLKAAEDALRSANEELERRVASRTAALEAAQNELVRTERLAVLGRLAGGLAHQIRNPLASITNASYVLQRALEQRGDPDASKAVAIILEEAWQANRIITDLIDYARVRRPVAKPTDLRAVVELAMAKHPLPPTVKSELLLPDHPLPAAIDPDQVRDALENLIRNAIEAMPRGGALTIAASATGDSIVISVTDTGEGVPDSVQEKLFEPLVTTKEMGLGLGLTTARALIENQRGMLHWEPTTVPEGAPASGPGARFVVHLPAVAPPPGGSARGE